MAGKHHTPGLITYNLSPLNLHQVAVRTMAMMAANTTHRRSVEYLARSDPTVYHQTDQAFHPLSDPKLHLCCSPMTSYPPEPLEVTSDRHQRERCTLTPAQAQAQVVLLTKAYRRERVSH